MQKSQLDIYEGSSDEDKEFTDVKHPKDPGSRLLRAAEHNQIEIINELLSADPSLVHTTDTDGYTPLHRAAYSNQMEAVKILLSSGARVDVATVDGWQPLHCACYWNNVNIASILLQNGANINAQTQGGQTPLHLASSVQQARETLLLLLTHPSLDPDIINSCNETAYQVAYRSSKYYYLFEIVEPSINKLYK